jgi:large subunit ribosomal protein L10
MNRDQKAVAIAEIAAKIDESDAIFAVDYRGISVPEAAELRAKLRESDATFKVVKNSLTERAADQAGAETLKDFLAGPTALTFVRGDVATAAKTIADYTRATQLLPFKGGLMEGAPLDIDQIRSLSRLPSRDVLYGQLVGVVASPVSGLVRSLSALVSGLAVALGQVREKKESGEIPAGEPPPAPAAEETAVEEAAAEETAVEEAAAEETAAEETAVEEAAAEVPAVEDTAAEVPAVEDTAAEAPAAEDSSAEGASSAEDPAATADGEPAATEEAGPAEGATPADEAPPAPTDQAEPADEPAQEDDNEADDSAAQQPEDADLNPTKED